MRLKPPSKYPRAQQLKPVIGITDLSSLIKEAVFSRRIRLISLVYWRCSYPRGRMGGQQAKQDFSSSGAQRVEGISVMF
jgi:hypothetical protein